MIRKPIRIAMIGLAACLVAGAPSDAQEQRAPARKPPAAARPIGPFIGGVYQVEGSKDQVLVRQISEFIFYIGSERWEGVGILDGKVYRGVFRDRRMPDSPAGPIGEQTIDWSDLDNPSMTATYTIRGDKKFTERWRRMVAGDPQGDKPAPAPPGPGHRPEFGEYVYVEELPEAVTKVPPMYPDDARESKVQGVVVVQALVIEDGSVADCRIVSSIPLLDEAAIAAVRQWRFKPALTAGKPVAVWVAVPIRFSLQ
jgi:TonB family protein